MLELTCLVAGLGKELLGAGQGLSLQGCKYIVGVNVSTPGVMSSRLCMET